MKEKLIQTLSAKTSSQRRKIRARAEEILGHGPPHLLQRANLVLAILSDLEEKKESFVQPDDGNQNSLKRTPMGLASCPTCFRQISRGAVICPKCGQLLDEEMWRKGQLRNRLGCSLALLIFFLPPTCHMLTKYSSQTKSPTQISTAVERENATEIRPAQVITRSVSALQKMAAVFSGRPDEKTIERLLDDAFRNHGLRRSEDEFERVGSVLVKMRNDTGVAEIRILACMVAVGRTNMKIWETAAICAVSLEGQR